MMTSSVFSVESFTTLTSTGDLDLYMKMTKVVSVLVLALSCCYVITTLCRSKSAVFTDVAFLLDLFTTIVGVLTLAFNM